MKRRIYNPAGGPLRKRKTNLVIVPQFIRSEERCHAGKDGDCNWTNCPQQRDGEPEATGRHCPLDTLEDDYQ